MVQPRVGKRRVVLSSSDNESENGANDQSGNIIERPDPSLQPSRRETRGSVQNSAHGVAPALSQATTASPTPTPTPTPKVTPKKKQTAAAARKDVGKKANTKTLYSFFNQATRKLQQEPQIKIATKSNANGDSGDAIEDDISDSESRPVYPVIQQDEKPANNKKRLFSLVEPLPAVKHEHTIPLRNHKFSKTFDGSRIPKPESNGSDTICHELRPWPEEYAPTTPEELVIHKKKVADVRDWLTAALAGQRYKRLLVLKGPAGSGKTITFSVLAKALGIDVVEWKNPNSSEFSSDDYVSLSSQFDDFLGRGKQFGSLDLVTSKRTNESSVAASVGDDSYDRKQVVLVEEMPYTLLRASSALQSFRATILQFLAASSSMEGAKSMTPLVFIISESDLSRNANIADNFTAYRLLGPEVLHHPSTLVIDFNAVAPTFISKALNIVFQKHHHQTGARLALPPDMIKKISEVGDVRNAVSTLEFIAVQSGMADNGLVLPVKVRPRTSRNKTAPQSTPISSAAINLSLIGLRESTIGLFHAIGKVVYNKRSQENVTSSDSVSSTHNESQLPAHASNRIRPLPSEVDIAALMDETGTDTSTFISGLHENYALSCFDPNGNSETTLDILNECLDVLGDADILINPVLHSRSGVAEGLRQEEIAFETGVRGLLFNLPHPVKRQAYPGKNKLDAHRMFYPTGLKTWRRKEEILELVDLFVERAISGTLCKMVQSTRAGSNAASISQPGRMAGITATSARGGVDRWRRDRTEDHPVAENAPDVHSDYYLALGSGHSARQEMLLERLPYLTRIMTGAPQHPIKKQIEQVTRFTGIGALEDDENDENAMSNVTPSNSSMGSTTSAGLFHTYHRQNDDELDVKGLVLSDDDIEDD